MHFTTSTSNIGTSCPLIFRISLVSEPHLDVYIQLEYLARSAYYIACWQGFVVLLLMGVWWFMRVFKETDRGPLDYLKSTIEIYS